ncbi:enoyl-[acyl-carrier protein] reductase/trans-2-enoyl-CoA reductase (NAD+) [Bacilli bacterium PM5-9]|nr:enoyl-[acyl-carrier protein] reductase/trans-2-enoyl-CoA reductase (NAD+) [Bacilli bacterium PM5-9]
MIIKPKIRDNIALNSHPKGCEQNIVNQIDELKNLDNINSKPLNVLIIGGSSGYGLASRLVLAYKNNAFTYNVSYESGPLKRFSGTAGFFNNYYFSKLSQFDNQNHVDLNGDCFSHETKENVINYFKENNKKIDLIVYSVASGVRIDPDTNIKYTSTLKPIKSDYTGNSVDIMKDIIKEKTIDVANSDEINNTIKVMGGEDFLLWIKALANKDVLNENVKVLAYTYIGPECTYPIYKDGTIGQAKRDLEQKNIEVNNILEKFNGHSYICAAKSVVTKASTYIPSVPLYMSALYKIMKENNTHETITQHIYRLFNEMIYGNNTIYDENDIIRLDSYEMDEKVQNQVNELLEKVTSDNFKELIDYDEFKKEFLIINGFEVENVDYEEDIDLTIY